MNSNPSPLTQQEYETLMQWNMTSRPYPAHQCLHKLFEAQVARTPDAIAVSSEQSSLTYAQLNAHANQLAHYLRHQGIATEDIVGICVERSVEMIIGLLGILKAGGTYLPLDPAYPAKRLAALLAETQPTIVLTQQHLVHILSSLSSHAFHLLCLDSDRPRLHNLPSDNPECFTTPDNLAYLLYTSGSTGTPKGVMMPHRAVCNHLLWRQDTTPLTAHDRFLHKAALSFDISAMEIFWPLSSGARLVLARPGDQRDSAALAHTIAQEQITVAHFGPAMLQIFLDEPEAAHCQHLTRVFCGGEALSTSLQQRFFARFPTCDLYQQYGPTETCIDVTLWHCERHPSFDAPPPIGKPIANVRTYILDASLQPVPIGAPGELYIAGVSLARGYWHQPARTREHFLPDPFDASGEGRLYRTGDRAYYLPDGNIEFLGRTDQQLKIRGFRVEPAEIEAALTEHPAVRQCCVLALSHPTASAPATDLVAYVQTTATTPLPPLLYAFLQERLPDYMLPVAFVDLEQFPLTPHSKIDRSAFPPPQAHHFVSSDTTTPRTPLEEALSIAWQQLLAVPHIGIHASFFQRGGNSLLATSMLASLLPLFHIRIPLPYFYEHPTIAEIAHFLHTHEASTGHSNMVACRIVQVAHLSPTEQQSMLCDLDDPHQQAQVHLFPEQNKNLLLHHLLHTDGLTISTASHIPVSTSNTHVELSFGQQRLWNAERYHEGAPIYHLAYTLSLHGHLDIMALETSIQTIVERHTVLRSHWQEEQGRLVQVVQDPYTVALSQIDLTDFPPHERAHRLATFCEQEALQPFDLFTGPLLRTHLLHIASDDWQLLFTVHHAVFDGLSTNIFWQELQHCYQAYSRGQTPTLTPLSIQYSDYACWQRERLAAGAYHDHTTYWATQLQQPPQALDLHPDYPRPALLSARGATVPIQIDGVLTHQLSQLALDHHCSLFTLLLTAWFCLLHRYSGQQDLLVATPVANRTTPQLEPLIGFFVNTLVLRAHIDPSQRFDELLARLRDTTLQAFDHQEFPLECILAAANEAGHATTPTTDAATQPPSRALLQTMLVLNDTDFVPDLPQLDVSLHRRHTHSAEFEITLELRKSPHGLTGVLEYTTDLFSAARMQRMVGHFTTMLQAIVSDPTQTLPMLPLLTKAERLQLLHQWNQTGTTHATADCIHHLFERQVAHTPDALAIVFEDQCLSYRQLNQQANRLAHYLHRHGIGPDVPVGLFLQRSTTLMIALLAILKAGGAYVPIDPSYPAGRIAFMIEDMHTPLLLTHSTQRAHLPQRQDTAIICLDELPLEQEADDNPPVSVTHEHLAYILYTSGSTGKPKGVMITHQSLVNHSQAVINHYHISDHDRMLQFASPGFDTCAEELFPTWSRGATVVMRPQELPDTFAQFLDFVAEQRLTILDLPTAYWHQLVEAMEERTCSSSLPPSLRLIIIGGEQASASYLARWFRHHNPHILLSNTYGPTEATIITTLYDIKPPLDNDTDSSKPGQLSVPIGRPIANARTYILDAHLQPVPIGLPGELYIGGLGLAKGYWQQPALTQQRFIANPFAASTTSRLYRSGDLVRYLEDGNIEFLGRVDQQVKIRGFRIELGEIEAVLGQHPAINQCIVVARNDNTTGTPQQLIAYYRPSSATACAQDQLIAHIRAYLQEHLPAYMLPAAFVRLAQFPLNTHGKIDRALLPAPALHDFSDESYAPPRNPLEEALVTIWSELLAAPRVGIHTSFFQLGGNSLLAITLVSRLLRLFGQKLSLHTLFLHPTIAEIAQRLTSEEPQPGRTMAVARALQKMRGMSPAEKQRYLAKKTPV